MFPNLRRVANAFFVFACLVCACVAARAQAQGDAERPFLHPLFGDHSVLQRGVRFPVWGWTTPGARVKVSMRGAEATGVADAGGRWTARLGPFDAGGPYTLAVSGPRSVTLNDVLVGDVWLASGQSNMEMGVTQVNDAREEVARADYPQIRLFQVPKIAATRPRRTVNARWLVCNAANVAAGGWGGFSAVAYFFGRRLHKELNVPIGLIHSSWGGTAAEGWVSLEALSTMEEFVPAVNNLEKAWADSKRPTADFDRAMGEWWAANDPGSAASPTWADPSFDASGWKRMRLPQYFEDAGLPGFDGVVWFRRTFELPAEWAGRDLLLSLGPVDDRDTTFVNGFPVGALSQWDAPRTYHVNARLLRPGTNTVAVRVLDTGVGGGIYGKPEQMRVEPAEGLFVAPVSLAGEWSYRAGAALAELKSQPPQQGGNDFGVPVIRYDGMIAPLVPFAVKGAIWYQGETNVGRAAQYERIMALLIRDWRQRFGVGDFPFLIVQLANFLERRDAPADSEWARLREAQLHVSRDVPRSGLAVTIDIGDAKDIHPKDKQDVGERLALAALAKVYGRRLEYSGPAYRGMKVEGNRVRLSFDHAEGGLVAKGGGPPKGFAVAGDEGRFVWAEAVIDGKDVVVSSPEVKKPVAVRYGWADNPEVNLYNRAGLPASPFRTDDFPAGGPARIAQAGRTATDAARHGPEDIYSNRAVRAVMRKVFDWQAAHPVEIDARNNNLWARAALYAGVMAAYRSTRDAAYSEQATRWAESRGWKLGDRPRHADDQAPGQTYLELYLLKRDPAMIAHTKQTLDAMLASPRPGREDWWWCDALFMAPPVLARLYAATGDRKYLDLLDAMWWDTTDFLFDPAEGLYYRDKNYIGRPNANGRKVFWSRGNGWVMGGTVRVLQYLPKNHPRRASYVRLLQRMAAAVARVQGPDGLWRPSLLDPSEAPVPETSGTGFFCYALAWGINNGLLDRKTYLPVVRRAWRGLVGSVNADGKLGWVQQIGAAPAKVTADDNQEYGSGALLLAGSEMLKLR